MSGCLFIVSAPSGAGKTTLVSGLIAADPLVRKSVSYTTRKARPGEETGRDYHFISQDAFERMRAEGEFLETALVHGNLYGTSRRAVESETANGYDVLLEIDWQGAAQIRKLQPDAVAIFILPPSIEALEKRLRGRGQDSAETIARRVAAARGEISHVGEFHYVIINDEFNRAAQDLISIIRAERLRLPRQLARHTDLINQVLGREPE
ncbi:MAG TPA: guanylate kinase [Burkholderiales bacterium]|nr:guanylate kinase [Burkholderiales bacterium]